MKFGFAIICAIAISLTSCAKGRPALVAQVPAEPVFEGVLAKRVHFPTGSDRVAREDSGALRDNARWMDAHRSAVVVLEGHCDERGGDLANLELGDRRARSVKAALIRGGVDADRMIMIVSYGERRPLDPRHTPEAWKRNRRVEFIVR